MARKQMDVPASQVERPVPPVAAAPMIMPLALDAIDPVIRIAHRLEGALSIPPRIIVDHELVVIVAGRGKYEAAGAIYNWQAGDLIAIRPFVPHRFQSHGMCDHLAVHFDFAPSVPGPANADDRPPYAVHLAEGRTLPGTTHVTDSTIQRMNDVIIARNRGTALGDLQARAHMTLLLATLLQTPDHSVPALDAGINVANQARLERAVRLMRSNFGDHLTNSRLAAEAGLSKAHFNRLFTHWTGHPPMEYLRRHRIGRARGLLTNVDLSIKEVAHAAGFESQVSFSKTFRQIDGVSPSEYRRAALAGRHDRAEADE